MFSLRFVQPAKYIRLLRGQLAHRELVLVDLGLTLGETGALSVRAADLGASSFLVSEVAVRTQDRRNPSSPDTLEGFCRGAQTPTTIGRGFLRVCGRGLLKCFQFDFMGMKTEELPDLDAAGRRRWNLERI